jgi:hypothetical protein
MSRRPVSIIVAALVVLTTVALVVGYRVVTSGSDTDAPDPASEARELLPVPAVIWDDYARADVADLDGTQAPTGQVYDVLAGAGSMQLRHHRLVPTGVVPKKADILYTDVLDVTSIGAEWKWTSPGGTGHENVVVGASPGGFGGGSVQLAVYAVDSNLDPEVQWELFVVPADGTFPYPVLASGGLTVDLDRSGAKSYAMVLRRTGPDEVTVELPDGSTQVVSDSLIEQNWGDRVGWQLRRPMTSDGAAEFSLTAAG